MTRAAESTYRCPGESYTISRAVHLGRLSSFYERCQLCPHRIDVTGLPAVLQKRLVEAATGHRGDVLLTEGISGLYGDQIDVAFVRRIVAAFGLWLRHSTGGEANVRVLLAGDDRALTADLVSAACEALRYVECDVIDGGGMTAAALVHGIESTRAAAGILLGNVASELRTVSMSFWLATGQPLSNSHDEKPLSDIWEFSAGQPGRPSRRYGGWQRGDCGQRYLDRLARYFHALRPLEFLLDTRCLPLKRTLNRLLTTVACRVHTPGDVDGRTSDRLHFRVWVDGNGESLRLYDERGRAIAGEDLFWLLAHRLQKEQPGAPVVVEQETTSAALSRLRAMGLQVILSSASRAEMHAAMKRSDAPLGGGPSGRVWFGSSTPVADALEALAQLLVILSQSDRPLSEVLRA